MIINELSRFTADTLRFWFCNLCVLSKRHPDLELTNNFDAAVSVTAYVVIATREGFDKKIVSTRLAVGQFSPPKHA